MSVKKIFVRDGMSYDTDQYDPGVDCSVDPYTGEEITSLTKQSFKDDCDINNIMRKYMKTGVLDHVGLRVPQYGEYMGSLSYQESLNAILYAQDQFASLSAEVRDRFGNDPMQLLMFMEDPKNRDEAVKLGLVTAESVIPIPSKASSLEDEDSSSKKEAPAKPAPVSPATPGDRKPS